MHTLSTRTLSALAHDRGQEEYDPAELLTPGLVEALSLVEHAHAVVGDAGWYEKARQRRRERRELVEQIPDWFSAQDLIAAPWETRERFL